MFTYFFLILSIPSLGFEKIKQFLRLKNSYPAKSLRVMTSGKEHSLWLMQTYLGVGSQKADLVLRLLVYLTPVDAEALKLYTTTGSY